MPSSVIPPTPIGPRDPLPSLLPSAPANPDLFGPDPSARMGWLAGSGPNRAGPAGHCLGVHPNLALFDRLLAEGE